MNAKDNFLYLKSDILANTTVPNDLYHRYDVKRGLRNKDGSGVLAGLTQISSVVGGKIVDGDMIPQDGVLRLRGLSLQEIVDRIQVGKRFGFEAAAFLLLVGHYPNDDELALFTSALAGQRDLSEQVTTHIIKGIPSGNVMNKLQMAISALYAEDSDADSLDPYENFIKSVAIIAKAATIIAYAYLADFKKTSDFAAPDPAKSHAENFLYLLHGGRNVTELEAAILDLCLVIHTEHGGGNNSTFTTKVVSSSGSDIYSTLAAAVASLKGPLHGSANKKVREMMLAIKRDVKHWDSETEVGDMINAILRKKAHDGSGKLYGLGHAVYTMSDPRAVVLLQFASQLAKEKGREDELNLYLKVAELGPKLFAGYKGNNKVISANVDFYSGFVYDCLGIPIDVYTPMFAMARVVGWCAHRMEELLSGQRIIRPGYKYVGK